jgi:hypothetical protein
VSTLTVIGFFLSSSEVSSSKVRMAGKPHASTYSRVKSAQLTEAPQTQIAVLQPVAGELVPDQ